MSITAMTTTLSGYASSAYKTAMPYASSAYTTATSYLPSMATVKGIGATTITAATSTAGLVTIATIATIVLATIAYHSMTNFDLDIELEENDLIVNPIQLPEFEAALAEENATAKKESYVSNYLKECEILSKPSSQLMVNKIREGKIDYPSRLPENWETMTSLAQLAWIQENK